MNRRNSRNRIVLDGLNSDLRVRKGCFVVTDENGKETRYPRCERGIEEIQIMPGNSVFGGAFVDIARLRIDCTFLTWTGKPVGMVKSFQDESHVETRVHQYEALRNEKGVCIAKRFVLGKLEGENRLLSNYGLKPHDPSVADKVKNLNAKGLKCGKTFREKLMLCEGFFSKNYFRQIFSLIDEPIRPESRVTHNAFDGINNLFNLGYEILKWKLFVALENAKLEPFLGYLHTLGPGKPSLVCDFEELYRHLIDDYVIIYAKSLCQEDFVLKTKMTERQGKYTRQFLCEQKTRDFRRRLEGSFHMDVEIPRSETGRRQELRTLINDEALRFAKYIRNETKTWSPRIAEIPHAPIRF